MFADHGRSDIRRRQFLLAMASVGSTSLGHLVLGSHSVGSGLGGAAEVDSPGADSGSTPVWLRPTDHGLYQVRIDLEIEGNVDVPKNPLVSRRGAQKLPLRSKAEFEYEERYRRPEGADAWSYVTMLERYYHTAESSSELNRHKQSTRLRESMRSTVVRRELLPELVYGVEDYFHRDELELLRTPVSSSAIDELLPRQAVRMGDKYTPSADVMMSILNLSSVESTDVVAEMVLVTEQEARIQFRGDVQGSVEGVPTTVRAAGKLTFDRVQKTCTWLAIAIHETRDVGKGEPGFDVAGTIKMVRKPIDHPTGLAETPPPMDVDQPLPEDRLYVHLQSDQLGMTALMERRWRMMTDIPGAAMMRMIDNDQSLAQCDFRPLANLNAGQQWTLEAFQSDIKQTLGDQLVGLVSADQRVADSGLRVMRVVARGAVEGIPIEWIVLHFSDDSGRRVLATFTMEGENVDAFAQSDEQLMTSLRFSAAGPSADTDIATDPSDRVLEIALQPPAATSAGAPSAIAPSGSARSARVESASDLR